MIEAIKFQLKCFPAQRMYVFYFFIPFDFYMMLYTHQRHHAISIEIRFVRHSYSVFFRSVLISLLFIFPFLFIS